MNISLDGNVPDAMKTLVVECSEPREMAVIAELESGVENELRSFRAEIATWASAYARHHQGNAARNAGAAAADLRRWSRERFQQTEIPQAEETQVSDTGLSASAATRPAPVVRAA
jgi:hypothetical protein